MSSDRAGINKSSDVCIIWVKKMDEKEHKQKHIELHEALDELLADFFTNTNGGTSTQILELAMWSSRQTKNPDHNG